MRLNTKDDVSLEVPTSVACFTPCPFTVKALKEETGDGRGNQSRLAHFSTAPMVARAPPHKLMGSGYLARPPVQAARVHFAGGPEQ